MDFTGGETGCGVSNRQAINKWVLECCSFDVTPFDPLTLIPLSALNPKMPSPRKFPVIFFFFFWWESFLCFFVLETLSLVS